MLGLGSSVNFLFLSTHAFLPTTRKTSVHFVSQALADRGHEVETISVGFSHLSYFKKRAIYSQLAAQQRNRFVQTDPRYRSACYLPLIPPFSSGNTLLNTLTAPFFKLYGTLLPRFMREAIVKADVIAIESGTAIVFLDAIRRANPGARMVYFARDRLDTVGASEYLQRLERRIVPLFDRIVVPSSHMAEGFREAGKVVIIPQGIDKKGFDSCKDSPYPVGTRNGVAVGNMLFDRNAVMAMATHAPDVSFHLFGEGIPVDFPPNVRVYGERAFNEIIPYIKFADFGLAPYRLKERELYLVESSLKLQQYSYCELPILAPDLMTNSRPNIVGYEQRHETDWAGKLNRAVTMLHLAAWKEDILSWDEVAARFETEVKG